MQEKEMDELELDEEETVCPNCGQHVGDETICSYCGAILIKEDDEFEGLDDEEM